MSKSNKKSRKLHVHDLDNRAAKISYSQAKTRDLAKSLQLTYQMDLDNDFVLGPLGGKAKPDLWR